MSVLVVWRSARLTPRAGPVSRESQVVVSSGGADLTERFTIAIEPEEVGGPTADAGAIGHHAAFRNREKRLAQDGADLFGDRKCLAREFQPRGIERLGH